MTVSSGWNSRDVSLNGRLIGVTRSTPGSASRLEQGLPVPISPTTAMTRPLVARWSYGVRPSARIRLFTPRTSASLAPAVITTNIAVVSSSVGRPNKKSRGLASASFARHDPCPRSSDRERHAGLESRRWRSCVDGRCRWRARACQCGRLARRMLRYSNGPRRALRLEQVDAAVDEVDDRLELRLLLDLLLDEPLEELEPR